jgi:chemotaxis protein methyltransferase CheR
VKSDITEMVRFMRFNLKDSTVFSETFDVIFCRNVMIYFDTPTQQALIDRFYDCLRPGGYLFVGHSEGLTGLKHRFRYIVPSVYRR